MDEVFKQEFYDDETTAQSAYWLLPYLTKRYCPRSVIDIGCGNGTWLKMMQKLGVKEVRGVDGAHSKFNRDLLTVANLNNEFPMFHRKFDLCLCLETGEHLDPAKAEELVLYLTSLSSVIIFSAAIPGQGGHGHINCQWQGWWAEKFMRSGFKPNPWLRSEIWYERRIEVFYRQNVMVYERNPSSPYELVLDVVHPDFYVYKLESSNARGWGV